MSIKRHVAQVIGRLLMATSNRRFPGRNRRDHLCTLSAPADFGSRWHGFGTSENDVTSGASSLKKREVPHELKHC
jgi:hypothetical protein